MVSVEDSMGLAKGLGDLKMASVLSEEPTKKKEEPSANDKEKAPAEDENASPKDGSGLMELKTAATEDDMASDAIASTENVSVSAEIVIVSEQETMKVTKGRCASI